MKKGNVEKQEKELKLYKELKDNMKNKKFPNKMLVAAYEKAKDKIFTWSPTNKKFFDEKGNCDYEYDSMIWFKENKWLRQIPFDTKEFVCKFELK